MPAALGPGRIGAGWSTCVSTILPSRSCLQGYISAVEDAAARVARLMEKVEELVPAWSMATVVDALQAMRWVSLLAAVTLVAEVRDFTRFAKPRQLMAPFGPDAERSLERRSDAPRRDHQGRQMPCPAGADRGRLDLSLCGHAQSRTLCAVRRADQGGARHRLEGAAAPVRALPTVSPPGAGIMAGARVAVGNPPSSCEPIRKTLAAGARQPRGTTVMRTEPALESLPTPSSRPPASCHGR